MIIVYVHLTLKDRESLITNAMIQALYVMLTCIKRDVYGYVVAVYPKILPFDR
jgi:hypothetical protein